MRDTVSLWAFVLCIILTLSQVSSARNRQPNNITQLLDNLLKGYDKRLRPGFGVFAFPDQSALYISPASKSKLFSPSSLSVGAIDHSVVPSFSQVPSEAVSTPPPQRDSVIISNQIAVEINRFKPILL
ncbi:hypothetical protein RRG08_038677 [Elysia crispata]|uniref:Uncharacterized protein n=1 Tax=Elysia crispata TaxID=231223 RepID=A0AAE0ZJN7_9GAST|nr:hypothetical protein RRG08_038677 [Elysia crispata]